MAPTFGSPILFPPNVRNYELYGRYYYMLPSFNGRANENPLEFIRNFYYALEYFPLQGLTKEQLKMRCFPYTLNEGARAWWATLPVASMTTWSEVYDEFMDKYHYQG